MLARRGCGVNIHSKQTAAFGGFGKQAATAPSVKKSEALKKRTKQQQQQQKGEKQKLPAELDASSQPNGNGTADQTKRQAENSQTARPARMSEYLKQALQVSERAMLNHGKGSAIRHAAILPEYESLLALDQPELAGITSPAYIGSTSTLPVKETDTSSPTSSAASFNSSSSNLTNRDVGTAFDEADIDTTTSGEVPTSQSQPDKEVELREQLNTLLADKPLSFANKVSGMVKNVILDTDASKHAQGGTLAAASGQLSEAQTTFPGSYSAKADRYAEEIMTTLQQFQARSKSSSVGAQLEVVEPIVRPPVEAERKKAASMLPQTMSGFNSPSHGNDMSNVIELSDVIQNYGQAPHTISPATVDDGLAGIDRSALDDLIQAALVGFEGEENQKSIVEPGVNLQSNTCVDSAMVVNKNGHAQGAMLDCSTSVGVDHTENAAGQPAVTNNQDTSGSSQATSPLAMPGELSSTANSPSQHENTSLSDNSNNSQLIMGQHSPEEQVVNQQGAGDLPKEILQTPSTTDHHVTVGGMQDAVKNQQCSLSGPQDEALIQQLRQQLADVQAQAAAASQLAQQAQEAMASAMAAQQEQLLITSRLQELQQAAEVAQQECQGLRTELHSATSRIHDLEQQRSELQDEVTAVLSEKHQVIEELMTTREGNKQLQLQVEELKSHLAKMSAAGGSSNVGSMPALPVINSNILKAAELASKVQAKVYGSQELSISGKLDISQDVASLLQLLVAEMPRS